MLVVVLAVGVASIGAQAKVVGSDSVEEVVNAANLVIDSLVAAAQAKAEFVLGLPDAAPKDALIERIIDMLVWSTGRICSWVISWASHQGVVVGCEIEEVVVGGIVVEIDPLIILGFD